MRKKSGRSLKSQYYSKCNHSKSIIPDQSEFSQTAMFQQEDAQNLYFFTATEKTEQTKTLMINLWKHLMNLINLDPNGA